MAIGQSTSRVVKLSQLQRGESCRIMRVDMQDHASRKRFAELGLAEGACLTVTGCGDSMMLQLGCCRMGIAGRCADCITVLRLSA